MWAVGLLFGLAIGSFLNVVILRLPAGEDVIFTRSHCPGCGKRIAWYDLIPVISFLLLKGRCRYCKAPISLQYPAVEVITGVVYALILWRFFPGWETGFYLCLASVLIVAAFIDASCGRIPNVLTLTVLLIGVAVMFFRGAEPFQWLTGAACVALPLFILWLLSGGRLIGLGDVKLFVGTGLILGWQKGLLAFGLSCILASVIHLLRMRFFHAGRKLALGPYLTAGILIALLFGDRILYTLYGI